MVRGKEITGSMWSTLAEQYVGAIVTGNINIESAYESMIRQENNKSFEAAKKSYKTEMGQLALPQEMDVLIAANTKAHAAATEIFLKTAVNSQTNQEYSDKLKEELNVVFDSIVEKNESVSHQKCAEILCNLYQSIGEKVSNGTFMQSGGHLAYKKEVCLIIC